MGGFHQFHPQEWKLTADHHHPIFRFLFCLVLFLGSLGWWWISCQLPCWVSTSSKRRWLWSAVISPWLRLVLFTMIGSKTSRGVRATNHSTRIRTSQLVYYCICHIYMNLWWVNGFSYLKKSKFYSSWNLGSVSIPRFFHFPRCHHSLANHGVGPSEKITSCHKRQMGLVGELVFSWENRHRFGHLFFCQSGVKYGFA